MHTHFPLRSETLERFSLPLAIALTVGIATLDVSTGIHLRVFPLYFVPLALVAGTHSRGMSVLAALMGSLVWAFANHDPARSLVYGVNIVSQASAFVCVALLVNNQKLRADGHHRAASTDALTGLFNARAFFFLAEAQLKRQLKEPKPLTMAYLDVDNFKHVNTALGHVGADDVLKSVADAMTRALRSSDVLGRIGGDEFALLLPGASQERAREVLLRVKNSVSQATAAQPVPITFSVGAVVFDTPPESVAVMMRLSDALMYRVKNSKKDGILVLSSSELTEESPS